jgi:hypothetical protein
VPAVRVPGERDVRTALVPLLAREGIALAPTGLRLRRALRPDECITLGRRILAEAEGLAWALGDLAAYVDVTYGGQELQRWAGAVGIPYETARRYRYVARQFGNGTRVPHLTHRHHLVVAARADRQDLLALAAARHWSAATLHRYVEELEARAGGAAPPWRCCTDVWTIPACDPRFGLPDFPGRVPGQVVANVLYYFGQLAGLVVDPMAGGGTTLDVCEAMGYRCVAFDLEPARPDILRADALEPWPLNEPADLVFLDPPYWRQQEEAYGGLAQAPTYAMFVEDLLRVLDRAAAALRPSGIVAVLIAPMAIKSAYQDTPVDLILGARARGWRLLRRFSVPVGNQQVGPQVVAHCKAERIPVALLRDLLVFAPPRESPS